MKRASEDYIKLIIDHKSNSKREANRDVGGFQMIFDSQATASTAKHTVGLNLQVNGSHLPLSSSCLK